MDETQRVQERERVQDLARYLLHARQREVRRVALVPVVLLELVQVGAQQLAHQEQVLLGSNPTASVKCLKHSVSFLSNPLNKNSCE